jgi:hypothetical protein
MSKVHLMAYYQLDQRATTACDHYNCVDSKNTTLKWEEVTCKNCMKTNEYKQIKSEQIKKEAQEMGSILSRVKDQDKSCHNCGWCVNNKCTHENPDVVLVLDDGTRCCYYTKEPQHTFTAKPSDPAIDPFDGKYTIAIQPNENDNKLIEFCESLSQLVSTYEHYLSLDQIYNAVTFMKINNY